MAPLGCSSSLGAASWGREGPSGELSTALRLSPGSAQPALPGRHEEGGHLLSSAQECLAESTVTQGSGCGPHVVTTGVVSPRCGALLSGSPSFLTVGICKDEPYLPADLEWKERPDLLLLRSLSSTDSSTLDLGWGARGRWDEGTVGEAFSGRERDGGLDCWDMHPGDQFSSQW